MRKFVTLTMVIALGLLSISCTNNNDAIYVSSSGEGSLVVGYSSPHYLYRMVLFSTPSQQELYLLGSSAYVDSDQHFQGRGTVVRFTMPNSEGGESLGEESFDIGDTDYSASYNTYVNYSSAEGEDDFVTMSSGAVIIRKSGSYYDVRLLGVDQNGDNVIVSYRGYIYRQFYSEAEAMRMV